MGGKGSFGGSAPAARPATATQQKGRARLKTKEITGGGLFAAAAVAVMMASVPFPSFTLTCAALSSFLVLFVLLKWGATSAMLCYITASVLSILFLPRKETALEFLLFFWIYPLVKRAAERAFTGVICWTVKLVFCNGMLLLGYGICRLLGIPLDEFQGQLFLAVALFNLAFVLYDICFTSVMKTVLNRYYKLFL